MQRGSKLLSNIAISAKLSERYIQTLHNMFCYVPFLFFKYVLFVNKGQDLH